MRIALNQKTVVVLWTLVGLVIIVVAIYQLATLPVQPEEESKKLATLTRPDPTETPSALSILWRKHHISVPIDTLQHPLPRHTLLHEPIRLSMANAQWKSKMLTLELAVEKKTYTMGQRDTHAVILRIRNISQSPVAFRVDTDVGKLFTQCHTFRKIQAHQFLLPAGGSVERMEGCTAAPDAVDLVIKRVQVMPLSEAAFITLSRVLQPLGLSYRMRSQHKTPDVHLLPSCIIPDAEVLQNRIAQNPEFWFEIMDFLARHDCATEKLP